MSVSSAAKQPSSSFQPFECHVCERRFTRHENLKRHAALHTRSAGQSNAFACNACHLSFSRRDLRHRHMKRKHPEQDGINTTKTLRQHDRTSATGRSIAGTDLQSNDRIQPLSVPLVETGAGQQNQSYREDVSLRPDAGEQISLSQIQQQPGVDSFNGFNMTNSSMEASNPATEEEQCVRAFTHWLTQQPSGIHSTYMDDLFDHNADDHGQETLNYDKDVSLEPSTGNPSHHVRSAQIPPSAASLSPGSVIASSEGASSPGTTHIPDGLSSKDMPYIEDKWFPSPLQIQRGYQLYFAHVSHIVPFIHRATFDATETAPHLGLSMLCLAYQHGEDPDCGQQPGSGLSLSLRCFHRARVLAASEEDKTNELLHVLSLVQAYWLLQVCAMMYLCGSDSLFGLKMHSRMISLARFGGLTQAIPIESASTEDLESLWRAFIKAESHKRTLFAVHQIDALWYQLFSIPRSLSHLEIKHDLPCQEASWAASSSAQWAHRQLSAGQSAHSMLYADAVRRILSSEPNIDCFPKFDLYGAINIVQFLLSSAREISGWSTLTGRLSLERFEPLRSSLLALDRLIRPPQTERSETSPHAISCEATWELAMIELRVWSPSHTGGNVGGSVDAFLEQSTSLATRTKIYETATAEAIQPHIDWYLRYLDKTLNPDAEPPWIALYAYKVFLIAWQLVRSGSSGAMQVVGVRDGDAQGAIEWARKVFHYRRLRQQQLSRLIESSLDKLE